MDSSMVFLEPVDYHVVRDFFFTPPRPIKEGGPQEDKGRGFKRWQPIVGADFLAGISATKAERYSNTKDLEADVVLTRVLGSGANGDVRLGEWRDGAGLCAVKSIAKSGGKAVPRTEIVTEVELLLSLEHPQIVSLGRIYESEKQVHLVMEHLDGGELFDRIFDVGFTESEASAAFAQMMQSVAYLHRQQVMHGDLKPENFVYVHRGGDVLKLIDFGFAARLPKDGRPLTDGRGSLHYVAPEVLARSYDEKADLWAMGVLLYVMLCGDSPWPGSDAQVLQRIGAAEPCFDPQSWARLSPPARALIDSLLHAKPARRPSAEEVLLHPWLIRTVAGPCATLPCLGSSVDTGRKEMADDACDTFRKFDDLSVTTRSGSVPELLSVVKPLSPGAHLWSAWLELCIAMWQRARGTWSPAKGKLGAGVRPTAPMLAKILLLRLLVELIFPGWRPISNAVRMLYDGARVLI